MIIITPLATTGYWFTIKQTEMMAAAEEGEAAHQILLPEMAICRQMSAGRR